MKLPHNLSYIIITTYEDALIFRPKIRQKLNEEARNMLKLRARSRSFSNVNTNKEEGRSHHSGAQTKDDINLKTSGKNSNGRVDFPQELARSLQAFATSLSTPSSTKGSAERSKAPPNRPLPPLPLKPILRSSASTIPEVGEQGVPTGTTSNHRANSSISSTGSSKQISFALPESPTRSGRATAPEIRQAAAPGKQSRRRSATSTFASPGSPHSITSAPSSAPAHPSPGQRNLQKLTCELPTSLVLPPRIAAKEDPEILHIKSRDNMHVQRGYEVAEGRRCSLGKLVQSLCQRYKS